MGRAEMGAEMGAEMDGCGGWLRAFVIVKLLKVWGTRVILQGFPDVRVVIVVVVECLKCHEFPRILVQLGDTA